MTITLISTFIVMDLLAIWVAVERRRRKRSERMNDELNQALLGRRGE